MRRVLLASFALLSLQFACVTPGHVRKDGFEHDALGYKIPLGPGGVFIDDHWVLEPQTGKTYAVTAKSLTGNEERLRFRSLDLLLKHKETHGAISVQSFPLDPATADRKVEIQAKDFAELMSPTYFAPLGTGKGQTDTNLQTTITSSKAGTLGTASTYEIAFEVSQLNQNPKQALRKYRMLLIRPAKDKAWSIRHMEKESPYKRDQKEVREVYPAVIVVTYANDAAYFAESAAAFDTLVNRIQLGN